MKARIKCDENIKFKPVTLEVTCQSLDEVLNLWHRLNLSNHQIRPMVGSEEYPFPDELKGEPDALWKVLNNVLWTGTESNN